MVRQENDALCDIGPPTSSISSVPSKSVYESNLNITLLRKLQELKEEYTSALEAAEEKNDVLRAKR